jgi:hypothetical protein
VEEVLSHNPIFIETKTDELTGEERIPELGHTNANRILFVIRTPGVETLASRRDE